MQEFKFRRTSINDEPRSGRHSDATTPEIIRKVLHSVTDERKLKMREIDEMVNISTERVHNILKNHLNMWKACTQWVPRMLTGDQKLKRDDVSQYNLDVFKRNSKELLRRFVTIWPTAIIISSQTWRDGWLAKDFTWIKGSSPKQTRILRGLRRLVSYEVCGSVGARFTWMLIAS